MKRTYNIISTVVIAFIFVALVVSCKCTKCCKKSDNSEQVKTNVQDTTQLIGVGTVSHTQLKTCGAVILMKDESGEEVVLVPKDALGTFDVEGQKLRFNYRYLRMPLPEGCAGGKMAEITNISKE